VDFVGGHSKELQKNWVWNEKSVAALITEFRKF
jgi:hypothetical protein